VHHIVPRIQGGSHDLENLLTLCRKHHTDRHPFMRYLLAGGPEKEYDYPLKEL